MSFLWGLIFLIAIGTLLYNRASMWVGLIATAAILVCFTISANASWFTLILLWLIWICFSNGL